MKITQEIFNRGKSQNGGWSKAQTDALGIHWPLKIGWQQRYIGIEVAPEAIERFLELKDAHLSTINVSPNAPREKLRAELHTAVDRLVNKYFPVEKEHEERGDEAQDEDGDTGLPWET